MLKHAKASEFLVRILSEGDRLTLSMRDNGQGMDLTNTRPEDHYGLENMQQRARDIGGTLLFESPETGGVQLRLVL
jgi:signal transduction histidine kinase